MIKKPFCLRNTNGLVRIYHDFIEKTNILFGIPSRFGNTAARIRISRSRICKYGLADDRSDAIRCSIRDKNLLAEN